MIMNIGKIACLSATIALTVPSCTDVLEEQPRDSFTPEFFSTEQGVLGGLTSMYAHLRYIYGHGYYYSNCENGTDEYTWAQSADNNFKDADLSEGVGEGITPTSSRSDALWGTAFANINTCNGVIENATAAGMDPALIAEAHFFRAFDYFQLVQMFGGVPLDLGSGELAFNASTSRTSVRNTVPEVYAVIIEDLTFAINNLPDVSRKTGTVTKTVARALLAKAYLTFAWWLENPNGIATYPACDRKAHDGRSAAQYFQLAYDVALNAIDAPANYGLCDTYRDVNVGSNDRNKEILLYADHSAESEYYNGAGWGWGSGAAPENFSPWMPTCNFELVRDANNNQILKRKADVQSYSRPWTRMAPTINALRETFADKTNDSRYDGTFTTVYRVNNIDECTLTNGSVIKRGEPAFRILNEDIEGIDYSCEASQKSNIGGGIHADYKEYVINPSDLTRQIYPSIWKLGPYIANGNPNGIGESAGNVRPVNIMKFSELYLIAAEAAVKGATGKMSARELVNVLRSRAGKWNYSNADDKVVDLDYSAAMVEATPATIDVKYILDERSREFFGEGLRWFDLVRTQMWEEIAGEYEMGGVNSNEHGKQTFKRNIQKHHYLRPIPQGQLDGMEMSDAEEAAYQNPGY